MTDDQPNIFSRTCSTVADFLGRWWEEATGPIDWEHSLTPFRAVLRRLLVWTPLLALILVACGAFGFYLFTGWRARDLTIKALASAEEGNARSARLHIFSAASLRPNDPAVKRATALIESRLGNPGAVQMWEELPVGTELATEEIDARAEVMALHGNDGQFAVAVAALEEQGAKHRAAELCAQRSMHRGDMEQAIAQVRAAVVTNEEPRLRLKLVRLLAARHGPFLEDTSKTGPIDLAAAREMMALIDGLTSTTSGDEALAVGLGAPYFSPAKKSEWAAAAWRNPLASNPALLPAAEFLALSGIESPQDLYNKLNILFIGAPLPQQVEFAGWMLRRGMDEQVLITASAFEAAQDEAMFSARASAFAALGRWDDLYKLAATPGKTPDAIRFMVQARAAGELGRRGEQTELARRALQAAVIEGRVLQTIELADQQSLRALADESIVEMCGDAAVADGAFRLARDRFGRRGQFATLHKAHAAARDVAPSASSVQAYERYVQMLNGADVDPSATAEALAANPTDSILRFNHALALFKAGQADEALGVFEDYDVIVQQLPPGFRAISAAVLHANGDPNAVVLAREIDTHLLAPAEYALIAPLRYTSP